MSQKWRDIRDKEGNHYIIVGDEGEKLYLLKMIDAAEATEKGLNDAEAEQLLNQVYLEDLKKTHKIFLINKAFEYVNGLKNN